jgi:hypothetical protein
MRDFSMRDSHRECRGHTPRDDRDKNQSGKGIHFYKATETAQTA